MEFLVVYAVVRLFRSEHCIAESAELPLCIPRKQVCEEISVELRIQ
jgi:hypothetical protein